MKKSMQCISIYFLICCCFSCTEEAEMTQEQEAQYIQQLFTEIETMAKSVPCENATEWRFTSYGSKACGGPVGFIAYSNSIDPEFFLQKVAAHRTAQENYNEKWRIVSDCSAPAQPSAIACDNGIPVFVY